MALQSNADLRLLNGLLPIISILQSIWLFRGHILGFLNVDFFRGEVVAPRPTPNLEDQVFIFISPGDCVAQLYPQAASTHFSRLLRHAWVTVGLFFSPVTTRGIPSLNWMELMNECGCNVTSVLVILKISWITDRKINVEIPWTAPHRHFSRPISQLYTKKGKGKGKVKLSLCSP
jgi:hypothetical protein